MEDVQATLAFDVHLATGVDQVVVDVYDLEDRAFAEEPVLDWADLDRLATQYGVPQERISVDDGARMVLDARSAA
jgi:hypothetical protein